MLVWAKRIGWGMGALLLLLALAFLSLVRITVQPAASPASQSVGTEPASAPAAGNGDPVALIIPVEGVAARQLSDTWGQSRGGGTREHHAIDIMAPHGTPVLAAASGTVEKIFESVNGGHTLYVRTRDRTTIHYYAHLDTYLVAEKQVVRQGEQIATVGNTGSAQGGAPHLHFEIKLMQPGEGWWQGRNINPYPLLRDADR
ncbi:murein DD-endopeptidase MepM/ murein hydrolase activator NlpD [Sphingomonas kyeonggiensis]|uniref:Murein DD-endopeptidase MepM/ murein hydrolase activator NlpD n=1 Tax=Sphingomonas kyeonggiensis TaxID=1268553 RepID=A0A7W7K113_9SPHN|nr:M23 family metallopeptidase [Sphingomonas kyeonggiensis]MBB4839004.1 murein DD-endopeptidase MepM/ murein hydrolase activator NlpD [Sphingomonas kyeonggiensis]